MSNYHLNHLKQLESEAIFVIREVAAQCERPVLLFSGGKDSISVAYLARKAFWPGKIPFPIMHIDTGHNFQETLDFRDRFIDSLGAKLIVRTVQESIDKGRVQEETGPNASRNSARRAQRVPVRLRNRRSAARRGEGAGQGALFQLPKRVWPVGPQEPASGAVVPLQRAEEEGRAFSCLSHLQLD